MTWQMVCDFCSMRLVSEDVLALAVPDIYGMFPETAEGATEMHFCEFLCLGKAVGNYLKSKKHVDQPQPVPPLQEEVLFDWPDEEEPVAPVKRLRPSEPSATEVIDNARKNLGIRKS